MNTSDMILVRLNDISNDEWIRKSTKYLKTVGFSIASNFEKFQVEIEINANITKESSYTSVCMNNITEQN
jgi:hypothetical protein